MKLEDRDAHGPAAHLRTYWRPWHRYLGRVILSKLFQETDGLEWVDTKEKACALVHRGFARAVQRRELFTDKDRPARETARRYEIRLDTVQDTLQVVPTITDDN